MTLLEAERLLSEAGIEDARHEARIIFAAVGGEPIYKLLTPTYASESAEVAVAVKRRAERVHLPISSARWTSIASAISLMKTA